MAVPEAILITGGSGFLGRALFGLLARERPDALLFSHARNPERLAALRRRFPGVAAITGELVGGAAAETLAAELRRHRITTVIHAAALKSIPEAEADVEGAVRVNVGGSETVADAAMAAGVERVIGVSSDKACAPASVYGMTKALMERIFAQADRRGATRFACVRVGNIFGSTGSVADRFRAQLEQKAELELTDPAMSRFCLSPSETARLVLDAAGSADRARGGTFVTPCRAYRLADVADAVWLEHGGQGPAPVRVTGRRPGEVLFDTLWNEQEAIRLAPHGSGFCLFPTTEPPTGASVPPRHDSREPASWLSVEDLRAMLREAAGV